MILILFIPVLNYFGKIIYICIFSLIGFGAGGFYGVEFQLGFCIMSMKATVTIFSRSAVRAFSLLMVILLCIPIDFQVILNTLVAG